MGGDWFSVSFTLTEVTSIDGIVAGKKYIIRLSSDANRYLYDNERENNGAWLESPTNNSGKFSPIWEFEVDDSGESTKYALKNSDGNYLGTTIADNRIAPTTTAVYFEIDTIAPGGTFAGFVLKNANGADNNGSYVCQADDGNGWNTGYTTTQPTEAGTAVWKVYEAVRNDNVVFESDFSNTKAYAIKSSRGYMVYAPDYITTHPWCTGNSHYSYPTSDPVDETNSNNQWAILTSPNTGKRYLYNIGAEQFLYDGGSHAVFSETPTAAGLISLKFSTGANPQNYPVVCVIGNDQINMNADSRNDKAIFTNWNNLADAGNMVCIKSVDDFDPTAALEKIKAFEFSYGFFETSTHLNPKFYTIKAKRGNNKEGNSEGDNNGFYLSYNGDNGVLQRTSVPTSQGLWYFVEDGEGVKMYNYATTKALAGNNSFTDAGITWYMSLHSLGYWNISKAQNFSGNCCFDSNNTNNGVGFWTANSGGSGWMFEAITTDVPVESQVAMVPIYTTDTENPIYYRIKSLRSGKYAAHTSDATKLAQTTDIAGDSTLWYFTHAAYSSKLTAESGVKMHNAASENLLATHSSFTESGATWYIKPNPYNTNGLTISLNSDLSGNCWDDQNSHADIGYWQPSAGDNEGTTWVLELVTPVTPATPTTYMSVTRATTLAEGKKYFIYNTCLVPNNNEDRTGFIYGNSDNNHGLKKEKPATLLTSDENYLFTLTAADGNWTLTNVGTGLTETIGIAQYSASDKKCGDDVYSENHDGTSVKSSEVGSDVWLISITNPDPADKDCWNGNPDSWAAWETGHPFVFYEAREYAGEQMDLYNEAKETIAKVGVGYPDNGDYVKTTVEFFLAADPTSSDWTETMTNALTAYKQSTSIQLPEDGKAYTIASVQPSYNLYFYMDENGLQLTKSKTVLKTPNAIFVCKKLDNKYVFVNGETGKYLVHKSNAGGYNSNSGHTNVYEASPCDFRLYSGNGIAHEKAFGSVAVVGSIDGTETGKFAPFTINQSGGMNKYSKTEGETPELKIGSDWSTVVVFEEVEYPNKPNLSAAIEIEGAEQHISTFSAPFATVVPAGVTAWYVPEMNADKSAVKMEAIDEYSAIPANTGVILTGATGVKTMTPATSEVAAVITDNLLRPTTGEAIDTDINAYILANLGQDTENPELPYGIGFYLLSSDNRTVAKGKAYLEMPQDASEVVKMNFGGEATDIDCIETMEFNTNAPIYDLSGRRVMQTTKGGIYIQNGKKFIVK